MGLRNWIRNKRKVLRQEKVIDAINKATMFDSERGAMSIKESKELQDFLNKLDEHVKLLQKEVIDMLKESEKDEINRGTQKGYNSDSHGRVIRPLHKVSPNSNVASNGRNVSNGQSSRRELARETAHNGYPYMFYPNGSNSLLADSPKHESCVDTSSSHSSHNDTSSHTSSYDSCSSSSSSSYDSGGSSSDSGSW